jgi:hypothetical protein
MKHSADGRRQQGTIRMLLKNCLALLVKEKYPQVITDVMLFLFSLTVLKVITQTVLVKKIYERCYVTLY